MPYHIVALPVSATNLKVTRNGEDYPVLLDTDTFDRAGEDGAIPIMPVCGGDEFVGASLEGQWHRNWDADISYFTATISGGMLRITGVATTPAAAAGDGWVNSHHPAPLVDELEVTVSLEVPTDDSGGTANRDIGLLFYLKQDKNELNPVSDNNFIRIWVDVDETGLICFIQKKITGVVTTLASGFDYTMDTTRSTGAYEATIWRVVFNGKPGTTDATISVYLKQAATLALAETATENELTGSPFSVSDLMFNVAYPAYQIYTQNATYFGGTYDSVNRASSTYLRLDYPSQFNVPYDWTEADYGETDVQVWDGVPGTGIRVYDEDHDFSGDIYIQNGLIRLLIDELALNGCKFYYYNGAAYVAPLTNTPFLVALATYCLYPHLVNIVYLSPERVIIKVRFLDSAVIDENIYIDAHLTISRGATFFSVEPITVFPVNTYNVAIFDGTAGAFRFSYGQDNYIADDDLNPAAQNNTTMTDNVLIQFDPAQEEVLATLSSNMKPGEFQVDDGSINLRYNTVASIGSAKIILGYTVFEDVAKLFLEAEDGTSTGSTEADALASDGFAEMLNAQNETVYYDITAGTDLPAGTYLATFRIRDINQIADDVGLKVQNTTDTEYRNEEGIQENTIATATYAYYSIFFFISDADVTATDNIRIQVLKTQADANEIYVDYFLITPIGNGKDWPQDLAHSALRGVTQHPRICER